MQRICNGEVLCEVCTRARVVRLYNIRFESIDGSIRFAEIRLWDRFLACSIYVFGLCMSTLLSLTITHTSTHGGWDQYIYIYRAPGIGSQQ